IYDNGGLGIDIGPVGVTTDGMPVLTSASTSGYTTSVSGYLNWTPNASFILEFFGNDVPDPSGYGEGQYYLCTTTVSTNSSGYASFSLSLPAAYGPYITATSTGTAADGNTSEFAQDITVSNPVTTLPSAPTVTSISPSSGPSGGGNSITITGTNFINVQSV